MKIILSHLSSVIFLLARALVSHLLIYNHLQRATVHSALNSKWIAVELTELENAYRKRIIQKAD